MLITTPKSREVLRFSAWRAHESCPRGVQAEACRVKAMPTGAPLAPRMQP